MDDLKNIEDSDKLKSKDYTDKNESEIKETNEEDSPFELTKEEEESLEQMSDKESIKTLDKLVGENDRIISKDYVGAHVEQEGGKEILIGVENIYYNPEKRAFKNRLAMKKSPPLLVLTDNEGNEVKFALTENLTDELSETLRQVKRAYYGFSEPSDINIPDKPIEKFFYLLNKYKLKIVGLALIVLMIVTLNLM